MNRLEGSVELVVKPGDVDRLAAELRQLLERFADDHAEMFSKSVDVRVVSQ